MLNSCRKQTLSILWVRVSNVFASRHMHKQPIMRAQIVCALSVYTDAKTQRKYHAKDSHGFPTILNVVKIR